MTPELNQHTVLEGFPFTVEKVDLDLDLDEITVQLANSAAENLILFSNSCWQVVTRNRPYSPYPWSYDGDKTSFITYMNELQTVCSQLIGRQLTAICGYENLHDNTFIFDNGFIVRFMTAGDDWGGESGNSVYLNYTDEAGNQVTLGAGADNPWDGLLYPKEMRNKYLPLNITTSPHNPFDTPLTITDPVLTYALGSPVVQVDCPAQEQPAPATYYLVLTLENGTEIRVRNTWSVASSRGLWSSQEYVREHHHQDFEAMRQELLGQRLVGFAGPVDLLQSTLLFDGGTRADQMARSSFECTVPVPGFWSVTNEGGTFKR